MSVFLTAPKHAATVNRLAAITDPADRLAESAKIARNARARTSTSRDIRNVALSALHLHHKDEGWGKAKCHRLVGVDRRTFDDALDGLPGVMLVDPGKVDWDSVEKNDLIDFYLTLLPLSADEVAKIAKAKGRIYDRWFSTWMTARTIRDEVALELMNGVHGAPWSNADVARATLLTTARVAQLRKGTTNAKAPAAENVA